MRLTLISGIFVGIFGVFGSAFCAGVNFSQDKVSAMILLVIAALFFAGSMLLVHRSWRVLPN